MSDDLFSYTTGAAEEDGVIERYGLLFPATMPSPMIDFKCWKHWREPEYQRGNLRDPWDCFWRGIRELLPPEEFVRHRWSEEHVFDWTTEDFVITWGAASSGKSNDYGLLALVDWLTDPTKTVTILASTSLGMLKLRSFESVVRYFQLIKRYSPFEMPGKLSKTTTAVIMDGVDDSIDVTDKASVRGVAVEEGTETEARAKLQGAHLPYVRLILDELSQMRPAAMSVRTNLAIGSVNFKLAGLCNVDSFTDLAARHSVPLDPLGFKSLDPNVDEEWRSQFGKVRRHDGLRSPAIVEPDGEKKYPFLLTKPRLDDLVRQAGGNWDDPELWTMVRAWPPQQGKIQTLISMAEVIAGNAMVPVTWYDAPALQVLGVDAAFSEEGNKGIMQRIQLGYDKDMVLRLNFPAAQRIQINASSDVPITEQIGNQIKAYADEHRIPGMLIGVDDAATQSVADWVYSQHRLLVNRFAANHAASESVICVGDPQKADERYYDQGTELWAALAAFIRAGQVRGLSHLVADQLTGRPVDPDKRPFRLISKKKKVKDGGVGKNSPDETDACAFGIGVLRFVLNLFARAEKIPEKYVTGAAPAYSGVHSSYKAVAKKYDLDATAYRG